MAGVLSVPEDITKIIDEFKCEKCTNGKTSGDIIIRVYTASTADECKDTVVAWILESLSDTRFDEIVAPYSDMTNYRYLWNIVAGTIHNDNDNNGDMMNQMIIAVHLAGRGLRDWDTYGLLVHDTNTGGIKADDILDALVTEPECVIGVGVSAVTSEQMGALWTEIVRTDREFMDGKGEGYIEHPMWVRSGAQYEGWTTTAQQNYQFEGPGWRIVTLE